MKSKWYAMPLAVMLWAGNAEIGQAQNSTIFGPNVYVFDNSTPDATIQTTLNTKALSGIGQFGTGRIAVLFMPGTYNVEAAVGFYESINGLGENPNGVVINGYLTSDFSGSNSASEDTIFWRSMENLTFNPATNTGQSAPANTLQWGVSQGASLRRIQVNGNLELDDTGGGGASGGFLGDTVVTGNVDPGAQHNWFTRNTFMGTWGPVSGWVEVFSGVTGNPPPADFPGQSVNSDWGQSNVELAQTPVIREKPFLYVDNSKNYNVFVPTLLKNSSGASWSSGGLGTGYSLPISSFFIATPSSTLAQINAALAAGQNLILTPGIYTYSGSINVSNANTIVLGMGYADLIPQAGTAAITVADVDGVQIAGLLIDAGPVNSPVLLQVGNSGGTPRVSHAGNPSSISDVHVRVGGYKKGTATTSFEIDSDNVILDNTWIWRADHGTGVGWTSNVGSYGLVVNGDSVTAIGLAVEHYEKNQVVWNGNGGETIFFQSELPYDPPSQTAWMDGSSNGYPGYYVSPLVTTHKAYGLGVYCNFNQGVFITEDNAIVVPVAVGVTVNGAVTDFLSSSGGQITHVVDNVGHQVIKGIQNSFVPFFGGVAGTIQLTTTAVLSKIDGGYQAVVTVVNSGTGAAQNVQLTGAVLGVAGGATLPASLGGIASGGSATVTLTFPTSAGADEAPAIEKLTGTYTGGSFGGSFRATLP